MNKMRCVIVHGNGDVTLADGKMPSGVRKSGTPYDLDEAFQGGARIVGDPIPIGLYKGTAILLMIQEGGAGPSPG